uniref:SGF29 C-terminal domain-containing protein n=1 Tax=Anguilla anguilla TaxID=7936 RepID=A0A0E9UT56_ANGAN
MWVLVEYNTDLYPGTITQIVGEQYEVDTMIRVGENRFFNPAVKYPGDKIWYLPGDIKEVIPEPLPVTSSRRHSAFCQKSGTKHY